MRCGPNIKISLRKLRKRKMKKQEKMFSWCPSGKGGGPSSWNAYLVFIIQSPLPFFICASFVEEVPL
jgi:hypothetical protein